MNNTKSSEHATWLRLTNELFPNYKDVEGEVGLIGAKIRSISKVLEIESIDMTNAEMLVESGTLTSDSEEMDDLLGVRQSLLEEAAELLNCVNQIDEMMGL